MRRILLATAVFLTTTYTYPTQAQTCHAAAEVSKQLSNKYDEAPVAFGLQSNGNLLQVYSSKAKGTWTVVSTSPAGMSCIVAVGKRWEALPIVSNDPMA